MIMTQIGRGWTGHEMEDKCPCEKEECGLVAWEKIDEKCPQHSLLAAKTIRQFHEDADCPALEDLEDQLDVEAAAEARKEEGTISHRDLMKELGL